MDLNNPLLTRISTSAFTNERVSQEKITKVLRAGMAAPSAGNQQPWEFYVTQNRGIIEKLARSNPNAAWAKSAGTAILLAWDKDRLIYPEFSLIDMACCAENIMIEANSEGLGSVFLSLAPVQERMDNVKVQLELPENIEPFALIPLGYAAKKQDVKDFYNKERIHKL